MVAARGLGGRKPVGGGEHLKEVKEEAGLDVTALRVIAIQDRKRHNLPLYPYGVCKIFVLCSVQGGSFQPNLETLDSRYFALDELPPLAAEKVSAEQIELCFRASRAEDWQTLLE